MGAAAALRRLRLPVVCVLLAAFLVPLYARAEKVEQLAPQGYVNDFAGVLDAQARAQLTALCQEVDQKTRAQIAVVTIRSLEGASLEDFSHRLATRWGVGYKGDNRGVLILLAITERKYRIEVGYGLEPILPDGKVGGFGREMIPLLRQSNYGGALLHVTGRIAAVIAADRGVILKNLSAAPPRPPAPVAPRPPRAPVHPQPQAQSEGSILMPVILIALWLVGTLVSGVAIYRDFVATGDLGLPISQWLSLIGVLALLGFAIMVVSRSLMSGLVAVFVILAIVFVGVTLLVGFWSVLVAVIGGTLCAMKATFDWYWPQSPIELPLTTAACRRSARSSVSWWELWRECFQDVWERCWDRETFRFLLEAGIGGDGGGGWGDGGGFGGFGGGGFGGGGASGGW
jgi:uncharacterized membrane protein YgcG